MALPPGLIQIKGRRGYYTNIAVPRDLRRALTEALKSGYTFCNETEALSRKATIQKKAGETLEEAKRFLAKEQTAAHELFDRAWGDLKRATADEPDELRLKFRAWKQAEEANRDEDLDDVVLSTEESLDLEVLQKVNPRPHPDNPAIEVYTEREESILKTAEALRAGLYHWSEWTRERIITSRAVRPEVKKRWEIVLRKFVEWSKKEYPTNATRKEAVEYKRYLLTRTSRTGKEAKQSSVAKELRDLSAFWNWARRHEWATTNIWESLASGLAQSEISPLPSRDLVESADQKALETGDLMYLIQRFTGCRKQAVCGLRGKDIDLTNGLIHFVEYNEEGRVRNLKEGREAHVPIHSKLLPVLGKAKREMPEGPIWPQQYKASEETWGDRYADSFPDKYGFNSHDLRRIVETQMAEANVSPYFVYYVTGHSLPGLSKTTQKYVRPTAEQLRAVVEIIH